MGTYIVDTTVSQLGEPFTVIYTHDIPGGGIAAFHYSLRYAVDRFKAAEDSIAGLGGYGTIIAVLAGHHMPVLQGPITSIWDEKEKYKTERLKVMTADIKQVNPAKIWPLNKPIRKKKKVK